MEGEAGEGGLFDLVPAIVASGHSKFAPPARHAQPSLTSSQRDFAVSGGTALCDQANGLGWRERGVAT